MSGYRDQNRIKLVHASQNYLTCSKTIKRLLDKTSIDINDHVIEIGPGKGHITRMLLQRCSHVTAVEIDSQLYEKLREKFINEKALKLYRQDFLKWRLPAAGSYKVFSNIPFCYTTAIVRKLLICSDPPSEAWLTMEKGAAKRFMGKPCESISSIKLKKVFSPDIAYYFRREDFHPMPGADVVLLHLKKTKI
jgi:23S rRNA (adenine-N6)-dimethyltransferase